MREREQGHASRIRAQGAASHAHPREAVRLQQVRFVFGPPAFGADGEQDAPLAAGHGIEHGNIAPRVSGKAKRIRREPIEIVFDKNFDLLVNADFRQARILRLLEPLDQQRPEEVRIQHVRVEVISLHFPRVGQDDAADSQRGELGPESLHDLRAGKREQKINPRTRRGLATQTALNLNLIAVHPNCFRNAKRTVENAHTQRIAGLRMKHGSDVKRPVIAQHDARGINDLARFEKNQIHSPA